MRKCAFYVVFYDVLYDVLYDVFYGAATPPPGGGWGPRTGFTPAGMGFTS